MSFDADNHSTSAQDMDIGNVMNFLNEVANDYPEAISLASGRPNPSFYEPARWQQYQQQFVQYNAKQLNLSEQQVTTRLSEYGPAAGIINDILAKYLAKDEQLVVDARQIIVTNGFQEAVTLLCLNWLKKEQDCIVTIDPCYIGVSALLASLGKKVIGLDANSLSYVDEKGVRHFDFAKLSAQINDLKAQGLNPKGLYVNPDFNNPLAYCLSKKERLGLIQACADVALPIIEDSPYARFDYRDEQIRQAEKIVSLAALDTFGLVYHIGSFSKTYCPGVRIGFLVVPKSASNSYEQLVSLKSLVSVNTSAATQSIVGGFLIANDFSLTEHLKPIVAQYASQHDALIAALEAHLSDIEGVSYEKPNGGFFAVVNLPFDFNASDVFACAQEHQVICMPVSFFCLNENQFKRQLRLSFSYYDGEKINQGVARLAQFIRQKRSVLGHKTSGSEDSDAGISKGNKRESK